MGACEPGELGVPRGPAAEVVVVVHLAKSPPVRDEHARAVGHDRNDRVPHAHRGLTQGPGGHEQRTARADPPQGSLEGRRVRDARDAAISIREPIGIDQRQA